ncbi:hypothetical protein [Nostoc piscinale]|uniref:hypothetical protein n=1 Tax=Nostoc piscinale TaxID=224012 RepID=UPI0007848961|nr:hypothetical protein [Nostoc piscinale]
MKRFTSLVLVGAISISCLSPRPSQANPAVLAPAAFCAGTAGVGCVLIGVATVGGIGYYFWSHRKGKKTYAIQSTQDGQVFATWDTEKENRHTVYGDESTCQKMGKNRGFGRLIKVIPESRGQVTCVFQGKQTNFGGGD